ncbi:MAG: ABC transporter ATP-binding protein [Bacillota bacterium]
MTTLSLRRVSKSFGRTRVLHDLSLDVAPGEVVALLGPNGAGKTTTLRLIAGLIRPDEGEILIGGKSLLRNRQLCQRSVGYLPDTPFVYPNLTGREMLLLVSDLRRLPRSESLPRIEQLLAQFDLTEDADRLTGEYSLGMKRKLGLCMALLHRPSLLLLDEPLNGLDPGQARLFKDVIFRLRSQNCAVLMSTHLLPTAQEMSDAVCILDKGRLVGGKWSPAKQPGSLEEQYFRVLQGTQAG